MANETARGSAKGSARNKRKMHQQILLEIQAEKRPYPMKYSDKRAYWSNEKLGSPSSYHFYLFSLNSN